MPQLLVQLGEALAHRACSAPATLSAGQAHQVSRLIATMTPLIGCSGRFSATGRETQPGLAIGRHIGVLRGVASGCVDQHRVFGEPPVAVAGAAGACHGALASGAG